MDNGLKHESPIYYENIFFNALPYICLYFYLYLVFTFPTESPAGSLLVHVRFSKSVVE
jgi:hypothetical protein